MQLDSTKLVIPDATNNYLGGELIQIDDISGSGQKTITGADIGLGTFTPYDVDFDSLAVKCVLAVFRFLGQCDEQE